MSQNDQMQKSCTPPELLGPEEIRTYQVHLVQEKRVSWSAFNIAVSAMKFVYAVTLAKDWAVQKIPYAKKPRTKPVILSKEEVCTFLEALSNIKYRVLVMIAYATGLRHSEVLHLRVPDIDSKRMMIRVELGKGNKDRLWAAAHNRSYVPEKVMCRGIASISWRHQVLANATRVRLGEHCT
jgi:site-specific recombinase XerD